MKSFLFIPYVNSPDLLQKAVKSLHFGHHEKYIIFNQSGIEIPSYIIADTPFEIFNQETRISFVAVNNFFRTFAIENGYQFYCYMHADAEILDDSDIRLVAAAKSLNDKWGVILTRYDTLAAFNTLAFMEVGIWGDHLWPKEHMSGYHSDADYYTRVRIAGFNIYQLLNTKINHFGSATIKNSPDEFQHNKEKMPLVTEHMIKKWGLNKELPIGDQLIKLAVHNPIKVLS